MRTLSAMVLSSVVAGALAAGCSSSGSAKSSGNFQGTADAACDRTNTALDKIPNPTGANAQTASSLTQSVTPLTQLKTAFKGLTPPSKDRASFNRAIAGLQTLISDTQKASTAAGSGSDGEYRSAVSALQTDLTNLQTPLTAMGLTTCANDLSGSSEGSTTSALPGDQLRFG